MGPTRCTRWSSPARSSLAGSSPRRTPEGQAPGSAPTRPQDLVRSDPGPLHGHGHLPSGAAAVRHRRAGRLPRDGRGRCRVFLRVGAVVQATCRPRSGQLGPTTIPPSRPCDHRGKFVRAARNHLAAGGDRPALPAGFRWRDLLHRCGHDRHGPRACSPPRRGHHRFQSFPLWGYRGGAGTRGIPGAKWELRPCLDSRRNDRDPGNGGRRHGAGNAGNQNPGPSTIAVPSPRVHLTRLGPAIRSNRLCVDHFFLADIRTSDRTR